MPVKTRPTKTNLYQKDKKHGPVTITRKLNGEWFTVTGEIEPYGKKRSLEDVETRKAHIDDLFLHKENSGEKH